MFSLHFFIKTIICLAGSTVFFSSPLHFYCLTFDISISVFTKKELNQLLDRSDLTHKSKGKEVPEQNLTGVFKVINVGEDE